MTTEPSDHPAPPTPTLTLEELAALPLDRMVVSACLEAWQPPAIGESAAVVRDGLGAVGGIVHKFEAARTQFPEGSLAAFGVAAGQKDSLHPGDTVVRGATLTDLLNGLGEKLTTIYGPIEALPLGLDDGAGPYAAAQFYPFVRLDRHVARALTRPDCDRGYLIIEGGPGRGKTSWALNWQRVSARQNLAAWARASAPITDSPQSATVDRLPPLSGWYFARRYADADHLNEAVALQSLISQARLRRGKPPKNNDPWLLGPELRSRYQVGIGEHERLLRQAFSEALEELKPVTPDEPPLVLLLDGGDEIWGFGGHTTQHRQDFPACLPTELPPGTFIVLLSRPGDFLPPDQENKVKPILHYRFGPRRVHATIRSYLNHLASNPDSLANHGILFNPEEQQALRHPDFQRRICEASEGAFGYATELMKDLFNPSDEDNNRSLNKENKDKKRLDKLVQWRTQPESLPKGIYGLRARELVDVVEVLATGAAHAGSRDAADRAARLFIEAEAKDVFIEALATLAVLRQPLTLMGLTELVAGESAEEEQARQAFIKSLTPQQRRFVKIDDGKNKSTQLKMMLEQSRQFFMPWRPNQDTPRRLVLDHTLTGELALAYWHLRDQGKLPEDKNKHASTIADQAKSIREIDVTRLHQWIGERCARDWPTVEQVRPYTQLQINTWDDAKRYAILWGLWHAFVGDRQPSLSETPSATVNHALNLLLHAGYLQTAVRVGGQHSEMTLRETYLAADLVSGAAENQSLRQRIESAVLEWHRHLVDGSLQVGALLWNLLGGWSLAKDWATRWKESLDQKALVTTLPGVPPDFIRQLKGYNQHALSSCGQWLVTTDTTGAAVWDLSQGVHRLYRIATLPNWDSHKLYCAVVDNTMYLLGYKGSLILISCLDLLSGAAWIARYTGHTSSITAATLYADSKGLICLTHGHDEAFGVLCLGYIDIIQHAEQQAKTQRPEPDQLARYAGHNQEVHAVALYADTKGLIGFSGSKDRTVGLLYLTRVEIARHAKDQAKTRIPEPNRLVQYTGHSDEVTAVALYADHESIIGLTGSKDSTVGVLYLTRAEVSQHAEKKFKIQVPESNKVRRYYIPHSEVTAVALYVDAEGIVGLSGTNFGKVGVLCLTHAEVVQQTWTWPKPDRLALYEVYKGRIGDITTVALHADGERLIGLSGSSKGIVGVLCLTRAEAVQHAACQGKSHKQRSGLSAYGSLVPYGGHTEGISAVSLAVSGERLVGFSSSRDGTIGVLFLTRTEVTERDAQQIKPPKPNRLVRYASQTHYNSMYTLALHADSEGLVGISGYEGGIVGVLSLTLADITQHAAQQARTPEPEFFWVAKYRYNRPVGAVKTVALHVDSKGIIGLTSCEWDKNTVGVLCLTRSEIAQHAKTSGEKTDRLARYLGHTHEITALALHANAEELVGLSGSLDNTIGVLRLNRSEVPQHATQQAKNSKPRSNRLVRYAGHTNWVNALHLYADTEGVIGISGSEDSTIGMLHLTWAEVTQHAAQKTEIQIPESNRLLRYAGHTAWVGAVALYVDDDRLICLSSSADSTIGLLYLQQNELERLLVEQTQLKQPYPNRLVRFRSPIHYQWRSHQSSINDKQTIPIFWGISPYAVVQNTVTATLTHPPRLVFNATCPLSEPNFIPYDIAQLDEQTLVVGGACGSDDIALMLLEWITPTDPHPPIP